MNKNVLFILSFVFLAGAASAQLPTEAVDVIKDFNARLIEAEKVNLRPELPPLDTATKRLSYSILTRMLNVNYPAPKIRPLALQKQESEATYNGFARLGGGFPKSLWAEGAYTLKPNDKFVANLGLKHHSADNSARIENQRFSTNDFRADGTYYFDQGFAVRARSSFSQDNVFFYGYNDFSTDSSTISFESDDVKQRFSQFTLGGEIFNGVRTQADFDYSASFLYSHLQDLFSSRENSMDIRVQGTKWFDERHPLQVVLRTDFTGYRDTAKQSLNNIFLNPTFTYHSDRFRAKIGMNLASSSDEFSFFPDLELGFNVVETLLTAYVGANGNLHKNNFRNLSDYNPFIARPQDIRNTNFNYFYGGIKGEVVGANYQIEAGYKDAKDLALFLVNADTVPRFDVVYDTAGIFVLKGSLILPLFKGLTIDATASQNFFSLSNQEKAWHLPSLTLNVGAVLTTMEDRLRLRGDVFLENGVPYRDTEGKARNLNALFDLSASAEFMFTEKIGGFARVNNLLNNRRERWQYYPVFGVNALVGLSARF